MAWSIDSEGNEEPTIIMVATPHNGFVPYEFAAGLRACNIPFETRIVGQRGGAIDFARNIVITRMLQENCSHLFFVDSDIRLRQDTFTKLFESGFPVVSGLYKSRSPPFALTARTNGVPVGDEVLSWAAANIQVEEVPCGCLLVDRRVLLRLASKINEWQCVINHKDDAKKEVVLYSDKEAIAQGWKCSLCNRNLISYFFQSRIGVQGALVNAVSEDYYFSRLVTSLGLPLYVRNDVFVEHYSALGDFHIAERGPITTTTATGLVG